MITSKAMRVYEPGDIVFLSFPFADMRGAKRRPALVLLDTGDDDIVVARITGQQLQSRFYVALAGWQEAGLLLPSVTRLHKITTLEKSLVERKLGTLTTSDWAQVRIMIQQLWASV